MIDPNWSNDPLLAQMSPKKLKFLTTAIDNTKNLKQEELGPYFFAVITNANRQHITFNNAETELIVRVLSSGMNDSDRERMSALWHMMRLSSDKPSEHK